MTAQGQPPGSDSVRLATRGTVNRDDRCVHCGGPMVYRVDADERVVASLCESYGCLLWLLEIAE